MTDQLYPVWKIGDDRILAYGVKQIQEAVGLQKFTKQVLMYQSTPPIMPLGYKYTCGNCGFFADHNKCQIVSEQGEPDPGQISPGGWCPAWLPRPEEPPFSRWALMMAGLPPIEDTR
jgi:hypothetical protein